jgi:hypothetical protein
LVSFGQEIAVIGLQNAIVAMTSAVTSYVICGSAVSFPSISIEETSGDGVDMAYQLLRHFSVSNIVGDTNV